MIDVLQYLWLIIDVIIGIALGSVLEKFRNAMALGIVGSFLFSILALAYPSLNMINPPSVADSVKTITLISTATANFALNAVVIELTNAPTNLVANFLRDHF